MKQKNRGFFFVLGLLFIVSVVGAMFSVQGSEEGLVIANVGGFFNEEMQTYRKLLGKKVEKLVWTYSKLNKFMSFIDHKKYKETGEFSARKGSNSVDCAFIHMVDDFERNGGISIDVPLVRPLTGRGRVGKQSLSNHSERRTIFTKKTAINLVRHAIEVIDNQMSKQSMAKHLQVVMTERGSNDLRDWFTRKVNYQPWLALLTGYSDNLTNPADPSFGAGKSVKSHPNTFVCGDNVLTQPDVFDATYETAVATALATLGVGDTFSVQSVRDMVYLAGVKKIPKIISNGYEVYLIFIQSAQMRQLRQDPEWKDIQQNAGARGKDNQIFTGVSEGYLIEGAYVIVDDTIPAARVSGDDGYDASLGTINYGTLDYMANPRDFGNKKPAVLVGQGAITGGKVGNFSLTTETRDHGEVIEDGGNMIYGFERADIIDDNGYIKNPGELLENNTSLIYWSYSPDLITV